MSQCFSHAQEAHLVWCSCRVRMTKARMSIGRTFLLIATFFAFRAIATETPILVVDSGGHDAIVRTLAFSADRNLHSAGDDKVVRLWDINKGVTVRTIRGQIGEGDEVVLRIGFVPRQQLSRQLPGLCEMLKALTYVCTILKPMVRSGF